MLVDVFIFFFLEFQLVGAFHKLLLIDFISGLTFHIHYIVKYFIIPNIIKIKFEYLEFVVWRKYFILYQTTILSVRNQLFQVQNDNELCVRRL